MYHKDSGLSVKEPWEPLQWFLQPYVCHTDEGEAFMHGKSGHNRTTQPARLIWTTAGPKQQAGSGLL